MLPTPLALQEYRPGGIRDSACWPELVTNPDRQLPLYPRGSHFRRARKKSTHCRIQLQGCARLVLPRRAHQCIGDAWDPIIATAARVALPRLSNDDQERILTCRGDRKLVIDKRQIGGATSR